MRRIWPWTVSLPFDREEWRRRRDARRVLLEKVRARRRLTLIRHTVARDDRTRADRRE